MVASLTAAERISIGVRIGVSTDELMDRHRAVEASNVAAIDGAARSPAIAAAAMQVVAALPDAERIDLARRLVPAGWTVAPPG